MFIFSHYSANQTSVLSTLSTVSLLSLRHYSIHIRDRRRYRARDRATSAIILILILPRLFYVSPVSQILSKLYCRNIHHIFSYSIQFFCKWNTHAIWFSHREERLFVPPILCFTRIIDTQWTSLSQCQSSFVVRTSILVIYQIHLWTKIPFNSVLHLFRISRTQCVRTISAWFIAAPPQSPSPFLISIKFVPPNTPVTLLLPLLFLTAWPISIYPIEDLRW